MKREIVETDTWRTDDMHVVCPRAAGLDVHKMCITAAVRLCEAGGGPARTAVREFSALPDGLRAMTDWLRENGVTAAVMEGTGVYWKAPFEALEEAGIRADLLHAQHVRQIRGKKTDTNDSLWLARICQFGLALPSYVPPRLFRQLRQLTRYRRRLVSERSRARNRVHKTLDHDGLRIGGVLSDLFGVNGRRVLDGLVAEHSPRRILAGLTSHVRAKLAPLAKALAATLDPLALFALQIQAGGRRPGRRRAGHTRHPHPGRHWPTTSAPCGCCRRFRASTSAAPARSWSRSDPTWRLPRGAPPGIVGRRSARQQHQRGQATLRTGALGKPDLTGYVGRVRPRGRADHRVAVPRVPPGAGRTPGLQARHPRHRPQASCA